MRFLSADRLFDGSLLVMFQSLVTDPILAPRVSLINAGLLFLRASLPLGKSSCKAARRGIAAALPLEKLKINSYIGIIFEGFLVKNRRRNGLGDRFPQPVVVSLT